MGLRGSRIGDHLTISIPHIHLGLPCGQDVTMHLSRYILSGQRKLLETFSTVKRASVPHQLMGDDVGTSTNYAFPVNVFDSRNHHTRQAVQCYSHFTDGEDKTEAEVRVPPHSQWGTGASGRMYLLLEMITPLWLFASRN